MSTVKIIQHTWRNTDRPPEGSSLWDYVTNPVDLSFADPPYNYGVKYQDDPTQDRLSDTEYRDWVAQVMRKTAQMTRPGGMLFWLCPAEDGWWVWEKLNQYGHLFQNKPIIWYERFSQYQSKKLTSDYRLLFPLIVKAKVFNTFNPNDIREESVRQQMGDKRANPAGRVPGHVWTVSRLQGNAKDRVDWHPAQLPQPPLARIVQGWTDEGDTVLDAFAGAGSLGVVCKGLHRNFVGVEQSSEYCYKMAHRINAKGHL